MRLRIKGAMLIIAAAIGGYLLLELVPHVVGNFERFQSASSRADWL